MSNKIDDFKLVWAKMPLSYEELNRIDKSHRIRPYLLFMENDDYYYSFPCTSKYFERDIRYENSVIRLDRVINHKKSLILLDTVYEMPKENIIEFAKFLPTNYNNQLIKKIHSNEKFYNYPEEVVNYFDQFDDIYEEKDVVTVNNRLYIIDSIFNEYCFNIPVYRYPVKGTYQIELDSLLFYVDVNSRVLFNKNNIDSYVTKTMLSFTYPKNFDYLFKKVENEIDYSKLYNLTPGMLLNIKTGEETNKIIILTNKENELEVLVGREDQIYGDFSYEMLSTDINLEYEIVGTLNSNRLEKLLLKHKGELNHEHVLSLKK